MPPTELLSLRSSDILQGHFFVLISQLFPYRNFIEIESSNLVILTAFYVEKWIRIVINESLYIDARVCLCDWVIFRHESGHVRVRVLLFTSTVK